MIRNATEADIARIVELGAGMASQAKLDAHVGYDPESVAALCRHLIASPDGILICDDDGMIGGLAHPHPFNMSVKVGQELFWYSQGDTGLALLEACEAQARAIGVKYWTMICEQTMRPKAVGRLYERRGYLPLEHSYIKEL